MTGEVAIDGVLVPTLLLLAVAAILLSFAAGRLLAAAGLYRFFAYRALVDLCLFILAFGLLAWLLPLLGLPS